MYLHCITGGTMQKQQLNNAHVPIPGSIMKWRIVLVPRGIHQRLVLQQQLHHFFVPMITRLMLVR